MFSDVETIPQLILTLDDEVSEVKDERARRENFAKHKQLISKAAVMTDFKALKTAIDSLQPLKDPAALYSHASEQGLPKNADNKHLLQVIANHPRLSPDDSVYLCGYLRDFLGYTDHYHLLFAESLLDDFILTASKHRVLCSLYLACPDVVLARIPHVNQRQLWRALLESKDNHDNRFTNELMAKLAKPIYKPLALEFFVEYLNSSRSEDEVMNRCKQVKKWCLAHGVAPTDLSVYYKMTKQCILKIRLEQAQKGALPKQESKPVRDFIRAFREYSILSLFHETRSLGIYKKIQQGELTAAKKDYQAEQIELNQQIKSHFQLR